MNAIWLAQAIVLPALAVAVSLAFLRLVKGPVLADRVVAIDLMCTLGIAILCVYAVASNSPVFVDVGLVLALVSFLGTIAFARYMEIGG